MSRHWQSSLGSNAAMVQPAKTTNESRGLRLLKVFWFPWNQAPLCGKIGKVVKRRKKSAADWGGGKGGGALRVKTCHSCRRSALQQLIFEMSTLQLSITYMSLL